LPFTTEEIESSPGGETPDNDQATVVGGMSKKTSSCIEHDPSVHGTVGALPGPVLTS
jgi:hypothetical protein